MRSRSVSRLGATAACSQRATTERSLPVRSASSAWVKPAFSRASLISRALSTEAESTRDLTNHRYADTLRDGLVPRGEQSSVMDFYTEEVLPALAERLDNAFPEFGWRRDARGAGWQQTRR